MRRWVPSRCFLAFAFAFAYALALAACHSKPATPTTTANARVTLAVLPAESDAFPKAARAVTESLERASVSGIDDKNISKVSLEVVQLSIECVEPTPACYKAVGRSLSANRLLFAQISAEKKKAVKVSVTLFDVESQSPRTAEKVFPNEKAATDGIQDLVAEATR
ncbi:MAG TPA: hypothetical protein VMZ53_25655 [Kofleriaceae bacterium]|nr:hypothetical protein [Kofleriaceae bacterium]